MAGLPLIGDSIVLSRFYLLIHCINVKNEKINFAAAGSLSSWLSYQVYPRCFIVHIYLNSEQSNDQ